MSFHGYAVQGAHRLHRLRDFVPTDPGPQDRLILHSSTPTPDNDHDIRISGSRRTAVRNFAADQAAHRRKNTTARQVATPHAGRTDNVTQAGLRALPSIPTRPRLNPPSRSPEPTPGLAFAPIATAPLAPHAGMVASSSHAPPPVEKSTLRITSTPRVKPRPIHRAAKRHSPLVDSPLPSSSTKLIRIQTKLGRAPPSKGAIVAGPTKPTTQSLKLDSGVGGRGTGVGGQGSGSGARRDGNSSSAKRCFCSWNTTI
ncbi:hypothetical protein M427DRAFT_38411 [Gonapodya prolifera JEL478]|uniref:Uncharacterized protein n=1 Tax=Gonapodya prolifera (strain JEL478) TaxID=1344416 RepID=A0A138ZZ43_GONPJ|nr:hypothetical protein M427DRAFT_38411 [Gonapodya prolifera JEL478]|eukprot:KXS09774.1 hypothetical protein M427DRAFT_38411 [Gonapodya prolifera JEL478]